MLLLQRGGYQAYIGPLGAHAATMVGYLESLPGAHSCPADMNPASWMLDVLARTDSSAAGAAGAAASGEMIPGPQLVELLAASPAWSAFQTELQPACEPAPGAAPFAFTSVYGRSFPFQLRIVAGRLMRTYNRTLGYVYTRTKTLMVLIMLYGTVFYKVQQELNCAPAQNADKFRCNNTFQGVQAVLSVVFLSVLFVAVVHLGSMLPFLFRLRAIFYRERLSYMYPPEVHALSLVAVEIPWMLLTVSLCITPVYFMAGFTTDAASFFFYLFVVSLNVSVFQYLGMFFAARFPTLAVSGAAQSSLLPLVALFAGVYIPAPQIPHNDAAGGHKGLYLKWIYYANPVAHSINALAPSRFWDPNAPTTVNHFMCYDKPNCAQIPQNGMPVYNYYVALHGSGYEDRWKSVGYLFAFAGGLQLAHIYALRFKHHASH